jgi:hypothetical protein
MNDTAIFWPMLAHVLLVFIVYLVLATRRRASIVSGEAKIQQFKVRNEEPASSVTAANNIMNQFELPILFHVVIICLYVTAGISTLALVLAWVFAALRYAHAYVHLTTNKLKWRNMTFRVGLVVLFGLWVVFALHLAGVA